MMSMIERLSRLITDHPITDKLTVQTTAIASGASTVAVDTMVQARPELWFGFSIVDWAAIFSVCLALIAITEKVVKYIIKAKTYLKERKLRKLKEQEENKQNEL